MCALIASGLGIVLLLAQGSACARSTLTGPSGKRVSTGVWGGEHVALTVTDAGAHVEFDCAFGEIARPLTVDSDGRLAIEGVFVQEHAGPVRVGEEPDRQPARYSGRVEGETMTLEVTLIGSNVTVGTYTLIHGADPRVRKCR